MTTLAEDARTLREAAAVLRRRLPRQTFSAKLMIRLVEKAAEWCENGGKRSHGRR